MPQFAYRAKDSHLQIVEGVIEADTEAAALSRLESQGVFPIAITESGPSHASARKITAYRVPPRTLAYTTRQLADLLGGGLPLLSALVLLAKQTEHRGLQRVIDSLAVSVQEGYALSESLAKYPKVFPPLYVSLVRAGEVGGSLEQVLVRLADLGEHEEELRGHLISASVYPLFVLCIALAASLFLLAYVIPKLSTIFIESGHALPLPTQLLLTLSHLITDWWWVLGTGFLMLVWVVRRWHASSSGRALVDRLLLACPGIRTLIRKLDVARFAHNLGVMISQGLPVLQALDVVVHNISNTVLQNAVGRIRTAVQEGSSLGSALTASGQFPIFVSNMVSVGEESGRLDAALLKVASAYEREVDRTVKTLTTVLEPVLLVAVGGVLMFIVLAMLLPVFQVELVLQ